MATVNYYLDTRKTDEGFGIIKLRITHYREQKDYSTKIKIAISVFEKLKKQGSELDGRIRDSEIISYHHLLYASKDNRKIFADGFIIRAKTIIKKMGDNFDFDSFKSDFDNYGKETMCLDDKTDLIKTLNIKCETLKAKGQLTHGTNFGLVAKSLTRFVDYLNIHDPNRLKPRKNFVLRFSHVDSTFLTDWSSFMKEHGKVSQKRKNGIPVGASGASETTIGIYSRTLRVVFNDAIEAKIIDRDTYPFGNKRFSPPVGRNIKKALSTTQIDAIKAYTPTPNTLEQRSHDLWLFSYFGNGMNFTDILHLTWKEITDNTILFQRQKTIKTNTDISVRINETMKAILGRWASERKNENDFVFSFLNGLNTLEKRTAEVHQIIKVTNYHMNAIGAKLEIKENLNTYVARHSFATRLLRSNAPLAMIKEKLGHKKIATTESYLGSFEKEVEDKYLDEL
jgi:integrase